PSPTDGGSTAFARRVGEWARDLDMHGPVGVSRHPARVRELAKPRAVRPHREDLRPERVRADGIAARREEHRPAELIGGRTAVHDSAPRGGVYAALGRGLAVPRKVRELVGLVTTCADGEELADLVRVLAAVRRGCQEKRAVTADQATKAFAAGRGVAAVEFGQLQDLVAVDQKDLAHEATVLGWLVGIEPHDFMRMHTRDEELGHDVGAGRGDERWELLLEA